MGAPTDLVRDFPPCSNHAARGRIVIVHAPAWRADARRSCMARVKIAPISIRAAFLAADRDLALTPNQGLSLPVRLGGSRHNDVALVGEGLPLLLPQRGETIGQAIEIVIILQVFRTG